MLLENQIVQMTWANRNKKMYMQKGYNFTQIGDVFDIKVEDLSEGSRTKVKVKCDYCNKIINVAWKDYLRNKDTKYACQKCRQTKTSEKNLSQRQEYLYNTALEFCDNKGYTLLTQKEEIKDSETRVYYICPKHGIHDAKIYSLLLGFGCPKCAYEEKAENRKLSIDYVEQKINQFGGKWINKDKYEGWNVKNMIILCPACQKPFTTSYNAFIQHDGQLCPECSKTKSKGEVRIATYLENNNISFSPEHKFDGCRDKNLLPFDFYLPEFHICIEFHGIQHYEPVDYFGGEVTFARQKKHDNMKSNFCKMNGIKIVIIPYWEYNSIEAILDNELLILHEDIV